MALEDTKGDPLAGSPSSHIHRFEQVKAVHTDGLREFVKGDDSRVASSVFEPAQVLLTKARTRLDLFLRQALFPANSGEVSAHQLAHIHGREVGPLHILILSTIICIHQTFG